MIEIDLSVEDTLTMGGSILAGKMNMYKKPSNSAKAQHTGLTSFIKLIILHFCNYWGSLSRALKNLFILEENDLIR